MARERRGAGSSVVSIETLYYKTIYIYIKDVLEADETSSIYQDNILQVQDATLHRILRIVFTHRTFYTQTLLHKS